VSAQHGTAYFAPLLVVELANAAAPTLQTYYENQGIHKSSGDELNLIADIADGISALHMCGVVHGDLKPANILLFKDPEISTDLVAKVCDFGFADTNREHRGQTIYWAAPECRPKCPENVLINAGLAPFAADIFSFGLVAAYVALKGGEPLGVSESGEGDEDFINRLDHIKFCDETRRVVERNIQASVERGPGTITSHVQALIHQTLGCMPLDRIDSLESIRLQLTGK
jgi:serine/threonine protein kinase